LRDVITFANNQFEGNQYIVYGVKEKNGQLELTGLDTDFNKDDAEFQQTIYENIEPIINISFSRHKYEDKNFLVLTINADKSQRPFMFKKKFNSIDEGESWISIGSSKKKMIRSDFESIYVNRISLIEIILRDKQLFIDNQDPGKLQIRTKEKIGNTKLHQVRIKFIEVLTLPDWCLNLIDSANLIKWEK